MDQRWIPVAERLPEDGTYLTTLDGELVGQAIDWSVGNEDTE